jgi:pyrroloquinoline quinone biosynthesis protein E
MALAGDPAATDPACSLSPLHGTMRALANAEAAAETPPGYRYRAMGGAVVEPGEPLLV